MDLVEQMITFQRVVAAGSLSAAARARRMSLAAVSRQVAALEAELGAPLLIRTTRRLQLTDAGRRWHERAERLLRDLDDARAAVAPGAGPAGTLVVSASATFATAFVMPRVPALLRRHRRLELELRLEDRVVDLVGEGVDVAVRAGPPPPDSDGIIAHPVARFHRVAVAAPGYLARRGTPRKPGDLLRHDCLVQAGAPRPSWRFAEESLEPRGPFRSGSPTALRDAALAGLGLAYLPEWLIADDVAAGRLRRVLAAWSTPELGAWALVRVELRGDARVRAFVDALRSGRNPRT